MGGKSGDGYGAFWFGRKRVGTHRVAWLLCNGPIPSGLHVLHRCDTPACVNPDHLFLGTHQDNMRDRDAKGRCGARGQRGEKCPSHKLRLDDVTEIRRMVAAGAQQTVLAARFGVHKATINDLVLRKTWAHI